jgi:uncharacterized membrane protein
MSYLTKENGEDVFNKESLIPTIIIFAQMLVITLVLFNGLYNKFALSFKQGVFGIFIYVIILAVLCYVSVASGITPKE